MSLFVLVKRTSSPASRLSSVTLIQKLNLLLYNWRYTSGRLCTPLQTSNGGYSVPNFVKNLHKLINLLLPAVIRSHTAVTRFSVRSGTVGTVFRIGHSISANNQPFLREKDERAICLLNMRRYPSVCYHLALYCNQGVIELHQHFVNSETLQSVKDFSNSLISSVVPFSCDAWLLCSLAPISRIIRALRDKVPEYAYKRFPFCIMCK